MPKLKPQTQSEFISCVAAKLNITQREAESAVKAILATLQDTLATGKDQAFPGFGTFAVKDRPAKTGRNPTTGAVLQIAAKRVPVFKPGLTLKEAVNTAK